MHFFAHFVYFSQMSTGPLQSKHPFLHLWKNFSTLIQTTTVGEKGCAMARTERRDLKAKNNNCQQRDSFQTPAPSSLFLQSPIPDSLSNMIVFETSTAPIRICAFERCRIVLAPGFLFLIFTIERLAAPVCVGVGVSTVGTGLYFLSISALRLSSSLVFQSRPYRS